MSWVVGRGRGSWVVGRGSWVWVVGCGCGSWVWVWVNVVGKKNYGKNDKIIIIIIIIMIINRKNCKMFMKRKSPTP